MKKTIVKGITWGLSTIAGFVIADKLYKHGIKIVKEQREKDIIDMEVVEEES